MLHNPIVIQPPLFEEDYLIRTLGAIANSADFALTELIANAWDAGASQVDVTIPDNYGDELIVEDNGTGMNPEQFRHRWMTLGYNRVKYQGEYAEFPPDRDQAKRRAYGRNGVGRHGMLCFGKEYSVETCSNGQAGHFVVTTGSREQPFAIISEEIFNKEGHGTKLSVKIERNLPLVNQVRDIILARFLYDPQFQVFVNGESLPLEDHKGKLDQRTIKVSDQVSLEVFFINSSKNARTAQQHGIAFWVGNRLVGEPSWILGDVVIDRRTRMARRHTIVVRTDDLYDEVLADWSAFKRSQTMDAVFKAVTKYIEEMTRKLLAKQIETTKRNVLRKHSEELSNLRPLGKREVSEFVDGLTKSQPTIDEEFISAAVEAIINLEKSRSGIALLQKLSTLSEEDIEGLNRLLDDWSIKDALIVLDEIDRRLTIIQALEKLSVDSNVDELNTLHPLVTQARWLFGPEFDSPNFVSNISIINAVEKIFGKRISKDAFVNHRNRPDLVVLGDSTISTVGVEEFDESNTLVKLSRILIIELKRGGFKIGRDEATQAMNYVEDFLTSGLLDGSFRIQAFVVGHEVDSRIERDRSLRENTCKISICTYGQLIRTASMRLFRLRELLADRYKDVLEKDIVESILNEPKQLLLKHQG